MTIDELKDFVDNTEFTDEPIVLDSCTTIVDQRKFAETYLDIITGKSDRRAKMPYYLRLIRFKNIIENAKGNKDT